MTPWQRYQQDLQHPEFEQDPAQAEAVAALQDLYERLVEEKDSPRRRGLLARLRRRPVEPVTGLYLWGGVGRGKTYLVDTFYECLPFEAKRRMHFHRFMHEAHEAMKRYTDRQDPLALIAREFAASTRVLCFDEFFVSDIADAMILGGLLHGLFAEGVTLVATSNVPPDDLYRDGLQRERFVPAIKALKQYTRVMNVDGGIDYRLRFLEQAEIYHAPLDAGADAVLADDFEHIAPEPGLSDTVLRINGRDIAVRRLSEGVAWFDFDALCDGPRSQSDYMEIAREFHSVVLSNVPAMDWSRENQARRFIALVDEFYDRGVNLIISAEAQPDALYEGKRLTFEFQRTVSRLQEMQSQEYLAMPHRP
ncbi:AFG1 family ATPase [Ectothiorhodospiraceae bacterium WFHF3C12]|nr:AFG1 family ATPase [Ectothiorhodospiraceae bacterium WFHF3C12]